MSRFSGAAEAPHLISSSHGIKRKRQLSHLPGDSINPLSHSPAVLKQFHVAGLHNTEHLPSETLPGFPHRSWSNATPASAPDEPASYSHTGGNGQLLPTTLSPTRTSINQRDKLIDSLSECVRICLERGDLHRAGKAMAALASAEGNPSRVETDAARSRRLSLRAEFITRESERNAELSQGDTGWDQETQPKPSGSIRSVPDFSEYKSALTSEHPKGTAQPHLTRLWLASLSAEMYSAYLKVETSRHSLDGEHTDPISESDSSSAAGSVIGEHSSVPSTLWRASEKRQGSPDGEVDQARRAALKTMETVIECLESLTRAKFYRNDQELLSLYAAALLYTSDLHGLRQSGVQIQHVAAQPRGEVLREMAKDALDRIAELGGQIDDRLRAIF